MRDSEIQTDPWWHRSEGVPLLCCRGSHRKLEKAKWNARAFLGGFYDNQLEEDQDALTHAESLMTLDDTRTSSQTFGTNTTSTQRTVSCGPSYGSRREFPDPLDLWVSTYQKLRLEDEIEEEKISAKRHRLLKRQESRAIKRAKQLANETSHITNRTIDPVFSSRRQPKTLVPHLPVCVPKLDNVTLVEALDRLCRQLHQHSLMSTHASIN